jgi:amino acid adenylation domain-containing protein
MDNVADLYPLSPTQQGLLFHSLYAPQSGIYVQQLSCLLKGALDVSAFRQVWRQAIERHSILRTAFVWEGLDEPLQVVRQQVELPLAELDWRHLPAIEQEKQLAELAEEDRRRGFHLIEAPLMRLTLIRVADEAYQFVWCSHHLILDGWSLFTLLKEVFGLYEAVTQRRELRLTASRPYRDYIAWLLEQDKAGAKIFWREKFKGFTSPTQLRVGNPLSHAPDASKDYDRQQATLTEEATRSLRRLARQHRLTLNTLVQGAWALLLSRYSGDEDVVFGVTVANRPAALRGVEEMVGLFINTLPLRVRCSDESTLLSWLGQLQKQQAESRQYEHTPLVEIQGWSDLERGQPLFESIMAFENYPADEALREQAGGLKISRVRFVERTNYPLTVIVMPGTQLSLEIIYDAHRFDRETIARMLGHLKTLLECFVMMPQLRIGELPMLTSAERQQLFVWNNTQADYQTLPCLHEWIEAQAERAPDRAAVVFEEATLTYAELNARANQLARYLRTHGVGPEVLVGVLMERSIEMVVALLGILKAGGAYVPLDPQYPMERLAFMLEDAAAPVLLTHKRLADALSTAGARVMRLDADWAEISRQSAETPTNVATPDNLAYVIYTSGSTGTPKGAMNTHRAICNRLLWMQQAYGLTSDDTVLQKTPFSFDVSVWEFFWPLMVGASLVMARPGGHQDSAYLIETINGQHVTTLHFVPSMLRIFIEQKGVESCNETLLRVVCSGEELPPDLVERFFERLTSVELHNLYGPTEAAVDVTAWTCERDVGSRLVPIGRPIANVQIHLLDEQLREVPAGVPGELYIGGAAVGRGYLRRPTLTAERFIPNPYGDQPGARLYRTGDLARHLPDGDIEYLGRIDHQVKVRGFRIELGEIESALSALPSVREAVVVAREDAPGDKRLVAYVVADTAQSPAANELRVYLKERLPEYMVPSAFVMLDVLPLSPNGKINRRALLAPEQGRPDAAREWITPRSPMEEAVAEIWSEVLGVERVDVHQNFFEIGGHSLLAMQFISRVREAFAVEVELKQLFESPTIAAFTRHLQEALSDGQGSDAPPPTPAPREGKLPLSFAQHRLWFIHQLDPNSSLFNVPAAVRLNGRLNVPALERTLNEIVRRHEVLRTIFVAEGGQPAQVIAPPMSVSLPITDLQHLLPRERALEIKRLTDEEAPRPFDLSKGPLMRAQLLLLGEQEHVVLFTMHHIVSDKWSLGILIKEVGTLYEAYAAGRESPLAELPIQYADFAVWQHAWLHGEQLHKQLSYWKQQLAGAPSTLELPTDYRRPPMPSYQAASQPITISPELSEALRELSRREGTTLYMTLLAAFQTLLYRYTHQNDILVGTPIANRNRRETESLIGFFVNTLVLRGNLGGNPSFKDFLSRVREVCLGAYAHQDVPFEKLVEELQPERGLLGQSPIFQVMFALENEQAEALTLPGLELNLIEINNGATTYDITLLLEDKKQGLVGSLKYNTDLFKSSTMERMSRHFERLLEAIVSDSDQRLADLPLLSRPERLRLLAVAQPSPAFFEDDRALHTLFEQHARLSPNAHALCDADRRLTYRQLNEQANRLARLLHKRGVRPDSLVGILLERSADTVISILAVLKAGGAYLPLDPQYPQDRLSFMLADAEVTVLVTSTSLLGRFSTRPRAQAICLDADATLIDDESIAELTTTTTADNLAYVIYTSGSTGKPKGVGVTHGNVTRLLAATHQWFDFSARDVWTLFHSFAFDFSVWELWGALGYGGRLVIVPYLVSRAPEQFYELLKAEGVTVLNQTPSAFRQLMAEDEARAGGKTGLALRYVIFGGEALEPATLRAWVERHGDTAPQLINMYGITETTVHVTYRRIRQRDMEAGAGHSPIGVAIPDLQLYVLDKRMEPVPEGVAGELFVGGAGVARGYLRRSELTAERFVPDPFAQRAGGRLYRTGDMGQIVGTEIEYLGRIDQQVKVRGFRIELGEIEAALRGHEAVRESIVMVREDEPGEKRLVAYVVTANEALASVAELRDFLKSKLPDYMVPSSLTFLEKLPLTANGKVDRRALPAPEQARPELSGSFVAPRSPLEETVADIWAELLNLEQVGVHDNFFDLGGHSLMLTQLASRIREKFQVELPLRVLFETPTVAEMMTAITVLKAEQENEAELTRMLGELENLSPSEVEELLRAETSSNVSGD